MLEKGKPLPLLFVGEPPAALGHTFPRILSTNELPANKHDLYILVYSQEDSSKEILDELFQAGVCSDQIILCLPEGKPPSFAYDPLTGILECFGADSPEELRMRLITRIETQKHRKLSAQIESARLKGIPSELSAEEWCRRMEAAHLCHGFALALNLSASSHSRSIRAAFESGPGDNSIWAASLPIEELIPLCAGLSLRHWTNPTGFREDFRRLAANLPFRMRTDLRNIVERCLESVWKGISNVA